MLLDVEILFSSSVGFGQHSWSMQLQIPWLKQFRSMSGGAPPFDIEFISKVPIRFTFCEAGVVWAWPHEAWLSVDNCRGSGLNDVAVGCLAFCTLFEDLCAKGSRRGLQGHVQLGLGPGEVRGDNPLSQSKIQIEKNHDCILCEEKDFAECLGASDTASGCLDTKSPIRALPDNFCYS